MGGSCATRHPNEKFRRAVDMPVKEPPVTTTVAIPGAKVEEASQVALSNLMSYSTASF